MTSSCTRLKCNDWTFWRRKPGPPAGPSRPEPGEVMRGWEDDFEKRYTRELCSRIEESLDEERAADERAKVPAEAGRMDPVLCTKLRPQQAPKKVHTPDDRPEPGWVPRSVPLADFCSPQDAAASEAQADPTGILHSPDPCMITDSQMELLNLAAGESRRATVQRVLKSRQILLSRDAALWDDCSPPADECEAPQRSAAMSLSPGAYTVRPTSCYPSFCGVQSSPGKAGGHGDDASNQQFLAASTPRLMLEVELEPKQQVLKRLLQSRPSILQSGEGTENVERERELSSAASSVEADQREVRISNSFSCSRSPSKRLSTTPPLAMAHRPISSVSKGSSPPRPASGPVFGRTQGQEKGCKYDPEEAAGWTKSLSRTFALDLQGELQSLMGALARPGGIGNLSSLAERRSLRANSWRA